MTQYLLFLTSGHFIPGMWHNCAQNSTIL